MTYKLSTVSWVAALAFIGGLAAATTAMNKRGPLDAAAAAPKNHKVLFQDDHVRLLEVTVQPGDLENLHEHATSSVFAFDATLPEFTNKSADGNLVEYGQNFQYLRSSTPLPAPALASRDALHKQLDAGNESGTPVGYGFPPEAAHQIHNVGAFPIHFYRLEFTRVDGRDIVKKSNY